jgi:hypothetical protein
MLKEKMADRRLERIVDFYTLAKNVVVGGGFGDEIRWQDKIKLSELNESNFLLEAAWVVFSSGMRESVIRQKFPEITTAFCDWSSAEQITANALECRYSAHIAFGHLGKIDSIIEIAKKITDLGFEIFKKKIDSEGIAFLQSLPFIGPATCFHLAKNIGLDVVKPDRHLLRISALAGYKNPADFCAAISRVVGDRVSVVDLVVWRYATMNPGYGHFLTQYLQ